MLNLASMALASVGKVDSGVIMPRQAELACARRPSPIGSERSSALTPSLPATYALASLSLIPRVICILRHQVSSGPDAAHARGDRVGARLGEHVAHADLQAVEAQDVDAGARGARDGVDRPVEGHRHAADAHADVHVDGDLGLVTAGLDQRQRAGDVPGPRLAACSR